MKKLLLFLMVTIPILVVLIVKLTASVAVGDVFISVQSVSIQHEPIFAMVGESVDLSCKIYPEIATNKIVTWSSDNEDAATVDMNGHVEFVDIGSGYISATSQDGNMRAQCYFHVYDKIVHKVELSTPQNFVHIGDTLQLSATVLPSEAENKSVQFWSSDESVASVDTNGLVTGISEGYVKIIVTTEEGGFSDFVDLLVSKPVTALVVENSEIITSSKNVQVIFTIEPFDATNKNVTFTVDNPEVAMVNDRGLISFLKPGMVNLTITTVDGGFERTIKYIYTAGYAYDLILKEQFIDMNIDDAPVFLEYTTLPTVLEANLAQLEFVSDDEDVAFVDDSGYLHAAKGGSTIIRIKVHKNADEVIERQIYVNVISPAEDIEIADVVTAQKFVQLNPKSLPLGSTNEDYFYHIDETETAVVSETGLVEFLVDEPCSVNVVVYANKDYSDVSKIVNVTYTAGMASGFNLLEQEKTLMFGEKTSLQYDLNPTNASVLPKLSIVSSTPIVENTSVIEITDDGEIVAVGGGKARIMAQITLYDNNIVTQYCDVTVQRNPESVEILIDEEYYNYQYVTGINVVEFSGRVLPMDATDKNIVWSVSDKNIAIIDENRLIFNRTGYVTLTATVGQISNSVEIYYTGSNPVFGQVKAIINGERTDVPQKIEVGDSFELEIEKVVPSNIQNPKLYVQATNQKTASDLGVVLKIEDNKVMGVAGGTAILVVNISNSIRLSFDILVERLPKSISVLQANSQVSSPVVNLISAVSPNDTTNQKVKYVVHNTDVASVEGNILIFKKNGIADITAVCEADENVTYNFFIEKVEKDIVYFTSSQKQISVNKGDVLAFDTKEKYTVRIFQDNPILAGQTVAAVEDKYIRTLSAGTAMLEVSTQSQVFTIEIVVNQLVEEISLINKFDVYNDQFIVAKDVIDLEFEIFPAYSANKNVKVSIVRSNDASNANVAFVSGKTLSFTKAGSVTLQISSEDGNCSSVIQIRYTGGNAVDAELNVQDNLIMNIGQSVTVDVVKWLPFDCVNTNIILSEINSSGKKVIEINSKTHTITAVDSGQTKLVVKLSNDIVKEIDIVCLNKVTDILVEENILTGRDTYTIETVILPKTATIKDLAFTLEETDVATLEYNTLHFKKAGTVYVVICSTDGSDIQKRISVTSTMGYLDRIVLSASEYKISKNQSLNLALEKYPQDATYSEVTYEIISQQTADNSDNDVVKILENGEILGLYGGSAVLRIYATNFFGVEVSAECQIYVLSPVSGIEISFEAELQNYQNQNTFITSKKEIGFNVNLQPVDATTKDFTCQISNGDIAKIEGNKIVFLQKGRVSIKFISNDTTSGEKSKTYNFYYVGEDFIDATLDKTNIQDNVIHLEVGQSFAFKLKNAYPNDNENIVFSLRDTYEQRNDLNKQVASFENGTLTALNGGKLTFTLLVNNLELEKLTLVVTRDATDIFVEGNSIVYVSEPYYSIKAYALESDTHQSLLEYKSDNSNIATVSRDGVVTFSQLGKVTVTIYVVENPSISKIIEIIYTKQLQAIEFNKVRDKLYVNEYIDLFIVAQPYDADEFEYVMEIDQGESNVQIADLIRRDKGYRLIGKAQGEVSVTAKVKDKDIFVTKTFYIYNRIDDIALELDNSADKNGFGQYRVFGNFFVDESGKVVNTFQMNVLVYPDNSSKDLLEYFSSNTSIATVDENGVVTFIKAGKVTITVKQKVFYEGAKVASDSYEFTIVEGVNISNFGQYAVAVEKLKELNNGKQDNFAALVLQNDIASTGGEEAIDITYNLFGNGHTFDLSKNKRNTDWARFNIAGQKNLVVDNIILRATSFTDGAQLKKTYNCFQIASSSNILLYNTVVENAENGLRIYCAEVNIEGCIFRNILKMGINIVRSESSQSLVRVKDSIFTSSFCGIWFTAERFDSSTSSTLILEGEVRFYNWSTLDQLEQGLGVKDLLDEIGMSMIADGMVKQIRELAAKQTAYAYNYNGTTYYNFGVLRLNAELGSFKFQSAGTIDRTKLNSNCNYSSAEISGALNLGVVAHATLNMLSLSNTNPFIKPGDSYVGDTTLLNKIRKPCRF